MVIIDFRLDTNWQLEMASPPYTTSSAVRQLLEKDASCSGIEGEKKVKVVQKA